MANSSDKSSCSQICRFYYALNSDSTQHLREFWSKSLAEIVPPDGTTPPLSWRVEFEYCFYLGLRAKHGRLSEADLEILRYFLSSGFNRHDQLTSVSTVKVDGGGFVIEIGPRFAFETPFSTNAVSACRAAGLSGVVRLERSTRYHVVPHTTANVNSGAISDELRGVVSAALHDRMTECIYDTPPSSFDAVHRPPDVYYQIDLCTGSPADALTVLAEANTKLGLALDDWDMQYYIDLFRNKAKRNPTDVELFDLAQSNSEHSRHWFFKGRLNIDGVEERQCLFDMIQDTQEDSNQNNLIKFSDNSSAIRGYDLQNFVPDKPGIASVLSAKDGERHIVYTAETHNFPTGVCPFPGAATGTGGRIRDVHATGRGAHEIAGAAGYSVGNLRLPGYSLPWETEAIYPDNFASPKQILIDASNGASDYGNKFGEPVITGFARSFGLRLADGLTDARWEWIKPIMFSAGIGAIDGDQLKKLDPEKGMLVAKLGGPIYRIGVGGGSASSVHVQGDTETTEGGRHRELDFGAVQRGDPQENKLLILVPLALIDTASMEQKLHRAIRACVELGAKGNPILSIHDQGAGGNGNVLKEIVENAGAIVDATKFQLGDPTLSTREIWIAEYQENDAVLIEAGLRSTAEDICARERCPLSIVGTVTGDNVMVVKDEDARRNNNGLVTTTPVNLNLDWALGKMPQKVSLVNACLTREKFDTEFRLTSKKTSLRALVLPPMTLADALERVLRLPSVSSKRYLTNKVDRSVTGLIAQQQCVGMLHTPVADVAVVALSYFDIKGAAFALGEQPIKGLVDAECGARMSVGEALTNLVFAPVTDLKDVKCSGNWMWAAKLAGEGAELVRACRAMCAVMRRLGVAVDGGKDSLSMAAKVGRDVVKAPGTLVVSTYVGCPDVTKVVTPDLKCPDGNGALVYVRFANRRLETTHRLGGSALAQCHRQIGDTSADLDQPEVFAAAFNCTQTLINEKLVSAGHDVSDGGLLSCLLEMAFAGNCSLNVHASMPTDVDPITFFFAEELGIVLEVSASDLPSVLNRYSAADVSAIAIGTSGAEYGPDAKVTVNYNGEEILSDTTVRLRSVWEETSFQLEKLQSSVKCASEEQQYISHCSGLDWRLSFDYGTNCSAVNGAIANGGAVHSAAATPSVNLEATGRLSSPPKVAIVREEGSNGDREMAAAFHLAGFEVWDICMQDLLMEATTVDLNHFKGIAFVGGFSYADVLGSAKGWAGSILFHPRVKQMFDHFYRRRDTFSLGVCNGCQLMALLGWIGNTDSTSTERQVLLERNECGRFQSYFNTVRIEADNRAIMLRGMQGTTMGVWVSHGEGKFVYRNGDVAAALTSSGLVAVRYVDGGKAASTFPMNPNGSQDGTAAIVSADGRHLAMMPHPERCFLNWQWPHWPTKVENANWPQNKPNNQHSPWMKMFSNAFDWCVNEQRVEK